MRLAILSDIHGNADALSVVLESTQKSGCELYLIAGDSIGYYYEPVRVLNMLSKLKCEFVLGNHEAMLHQLISNPSLETKIRESYGSALSLTIKQLSRAQIDSLICAPKSKSLRIANRSINISHGAPWQFDCYIYPDSEENLWEKFLSFEESIFIVGNTHHQLIKRYRGKLILNPGSVGQSRTDSGAAQWAEIELSNLDITFKSLSYNTGKTLEKCMRLDPNLELLRKYLI